MSFSLIVDVLSNQSLDKTLLDDITSRRDTFRSPNDVCSLPSDHHSINGDLTNNSCTYSPSTSSSTNPLTNNIYTTGSTISDIMNPSSANLSSSTNSTSLVDNQQIDPTNLKAFESFYHGSSLNDDQLFIVIYLIDAFRYELIGLSNDEHENINIDNDIDIYVKKAIFRAYMDLIKDLPEKVSVRLHLQVNESFKMNFYLYYNYLDNSV